MLLVAPSQVSSAPGAPRVAYVNDASRVQRYECGAVAFPFEWQEPAVTERAAFESVIADGGLQGALYVGFPWATLIDALARHAVAADKLLQALATIAATIRGTKRAVTVCQHIHFAKYGALFEAAGITD